MGEHVFGGDAEFFGDALVGGTGAKAIDTDHPAMFAKVFVPAEGDAGFDGEAFFDGEGEHLIFVGLELLFEDVPGGHGDDAHGAAFLAELFGGLEGDVDFGAGGKEQQFGGLAGLAFPEDVGTAAHVFDGGAFGAVEHGNVLAGKDEDGGAVLAFAGHEPGQGAFVGVAGADDGAVGDGTDGGEGFDGFVGGAVFADKDGVVRHDEDALDFGEGHEADGRAHVVGEDEEGGAVGDECAVVADAGDDGAHAVLADAKVGGAAGVGVFLEGAVVFVPGFGGGGQVGTAAEDVFDFAHEEFLGFAGGVACGLGFGVGGPLGEAGSDVGGDVFAPEGLVEGGFFGVGGGVAGEEVVPSGFVGGPAGAKGSEVGFHFVGHEELGVFGPAEVAFGGGDFFGAKGVGVGFGLALEFGGAKADFGFGDDEGGLAFGDAGFADGGANLVVIVAVNLDDVPVVATEAGGHVVGVGEFGAAFDGDLVVVVDPDEVVEAEVAGEGGGFVGDAFLKVAVGDDGVDVVVADGVFRRVEGGGKVFLGDGHADGVAGALAEGAGGAFDAGGFVKLGVAGGEAVPLAEVFQLIEGDGFVAREVEKGVDEHGAVTGGKDEAVAVAPGGVGGVEAEVFAKEDGGDVGAAHGEAGVAGLGFFNGIEGEGADRVCNEVECGGVSLGCGVHKFGL